MTVSRLNILSVTRVCHVENDIEHTRGVLSMARSDSYNSASTQFFIVHEDSPHLNGSYAAFGHVTKGMNVVDKICEKVDVEDDNLNMVDEQLYFSENNLSLIRTRN